MLYNEKHYEKRDEKSYKLAKEVHVITTEPFDGVSLDSVVTKFKVVEEPSEPIPKMPEQEAKEVYVPRQESSLFSKSLAILTAVAASYLISPDLIANPNQFIPGTYNSSSKQVRHIDTPETTRKRHTLDNSLIHTHKVQVQDEEVQYEEVQDENDLPEELRPLDELYK